MICFACGLDVSVCQGYPEDREQAAYDMVKIMETNEIKAVCYSCLDKYEEAVREASSSVSDWKGGGQLNFDLKLK
jgi:hypothetical protein